MVDRRRLLVAGAASLAAPRLGSQAPKRTARVGILFNSFALDAVSGNRPIEPVMQYFLDGMREFGYVEGKNLVLQRRSAEGKLDRLELLARGLVELPVDVIVVSGNLATKAAMKATTRVPIVSAGMANPVQADIVKDLARPGGNVTGSAPTFGPQMRIKQMELLHELLPAARRVVHLATPLDVDVTAELDRAADSMRLKLVYIEVKTSNIAVALDVALADVRGAKGDAMLVVATTPLYPFRQRIVAFSARERMPDVYGLREAVAAGGLASFGGDTRDMWRRAARYTHQILAGANPGELPIEQTQRYVLALNRCRARALNLDIPRTLIQRADEIFC